MKNCFLIDYYRDCKEVINLSAKAEKENSATNEDCDKVMGVIKAMTREIHDRLNSIAGYVGIPCKVKDIDMQDSPATIGGDSVACNGYLGYRVDLTPYRELFSVVRFPAGAPKHCQEGVVRGVIIDDDGNMECAAPCGKDINHEWTRLPLTAKSSYLVATVPLDENGNLAFEPSYVEFLPDGLVQSLSEYMSEMVNYSIDISKRVEKLENSACKEKSC